jgi:hypothetical protein
MHWDTHLSLSLMSEQFNCTSGHGTFNFSFPGEVSLMLKRPKLESDAVGYAELELDH